MAAGFTALLGAAEATAAPPGAATLTVRADPRSGRLVRRVVVTPKTITSRTVAKRPVGQRAPQGPALPPKDVREALDAAAKKYSVDRHLAHSVAQVESGYNPYAISPKGAEGVMQLMPSTARRLGVTNSFDWRQNIEAGVRHLKQLQQRFGDDRLALAAYNAGEGAVVRYRAIPPYAETQGYVYKVGRKLGEMRRAEPAVKPAGPEPLKPAPEYRPLETSVDAQGRLVLRTR